MIAHPTRKALLLLFTLVINLVNAQIYQFQELSDDLGQPYGRVTDIEQDEDGFLWLGTHEGLLRYDGIKFHTIHHEIGNPNTLTTDIIYDIDLDSKGRVWCATPEGVSCYDPRSGDVLRIVDEGGELNYITCILADSDDNIWWGTVQGLFRLENGATQQAKLELDSLLNGWKIKTIYGLYQDKRGRVWIGGDDGVGYFDSPEGLTGKSFDGNAFSLISKIGVWGFNFLDGENGEMYIGTEGNGLVRFEEVGDSLKLKKWTTDTQPALTENYIARTIAMSDGKIWASTWTGGINVIEFQNDSIKVEELRVGKGNSNLPSDQIFAMFEDRSGMIWISSERGLFRSMPQRRRFRSLNTRNSNLNDPEIKSLHVSSDGHLYVGTPKGLHIINTLDKSSAQNEFIILDKKSGVGLFNDDICGITEDRNGVLWVSTFGGVYYSQPHPGLAPKFKQVKYRDTPLHSFVYSVLPVDSNAYWLCTYGKIARLEVDSTTYDRKDIEVFDMNTESDSALCNATVYYALRDNYNQVWFQTFHGLSKYVSDRNGGTFENYFSNDSLNGLANNIVDCGLTTSDGRLFLGTFGGLCEVIQDEAGAVIEFKTYGRESGLSSAIIHSIEEDSNGNLWLGTSNGLHFMDLNSTDQERVISFNTEDGLPDNDLVSRSSTKGPDGTLYFGTRNGLISFNPSSFDLGSSVANIAFNAVTSSEQQLLKPKNGDTLTMNASDQLVNLSFALTDFVNPRSHIYKYRLVGFDDHWSFGEWNKEVNYTNLDAGEYTFQVTGRNADGVWSNEPLELKIFMLPAWYETNGFKVLIILLVALILYTIYRIRVRNQLRKVTEQLKLEQARKDERQKIHERTANDFHDELGHRITKIQMYANLATLSGEDKSKLSEYTRKLTSNTRKLSQGVRDFIWAIDAKKGMVIHLIERLDEFLMEMIQDQDIDHQVYCPERDYWNQIELDADLRRQL
ncbi:MAG: two-component regulator propeller domain-containing protein, partial [Bacteroidota bacterium]